MFRRPPAATLCPYTTLFRSQQREEEIIPPGHHVHDRDGGDAGPGEWHHDARESGQFTGAVDAGGVLQVAGQTAEERSEEHTSELQSRGHLVCRLLLEKKKKP